MESWDERYAGGKFSSAEPHRLLVELVGKSETGKALDLACGAGRHANFLAENGWRVTAVDSSKIGVEIAMQRAAAKDLTVDYRVADLERGEFEIEKNAFDLICDFYYLQRDLFAKMKAGVRAGGIIISTIHIRGADDEKGRFLLKEGELREFFKDFEILHYHETSVADADAGEHHRRTAELVARRPK